MSNNMKDLRKQLRNIVQDLYPEILTHELMEKLDKKLTDTLMKRLAAIDQRQKDMLGFFVRQASQPAAPPQQPAAATPVSESVSAQEPPKE